MKVPQLKISISHKNYEFHFNFRKHPQKYIPSSWRWLFAKITRDYKLKFFSPYSRSDLASVSYTHIKWDGMLQKYQKN